MKQINVGDLFVATIKRKPCHDFISRIHRHHHPPQGEQFRVAVYLRKEENLDELVGVGTFGRPVSHILDDGDTGEITRVATIDDCPKNACSMIYGRLCRAAESIGYTSVVTYTLEHETGSSLLASGFHVDGKTKGGDWGTRRFFYREQNGILIQEKADITGPKTRWRRNLNP